MVSKEEFEEVLVAIMRNLYKTLPEDEATQVIGRALGEIVRDQGEQEHQQPGEWRS